jgi:hypothetical protein
MEEKEVLTDEMIDSRLLQFRVARTVAPLKGWSLVHAVNRLLRDEPLDMFQASAILEEVERSTKLTGR